MKYQLAIDTSTDTCSVALRADREIISENAQGKGIHSEQLFLQIQKLLLSKKLTIPQIDLVLVSGGPGSYTGLRISASALKGLFFGLQTPVFACNTLAGFAAGIDENVTVHAIIDARRQHVYYQSFQLSAKHISVQNEVSVVTLSSLTDHIKTEHVIAGTGYERLPEVITASKISNPVHAAHLFRLYDFWQAAQCPKELITETTAKDLEPQYYSNSQVAGNVGR